MYVYEKEACGVESVVSVAVGSQAVQTRKFK